MVTRGATRSRSGAATIGAIHVLRRSGRWASPSRWAERRRRRSRPESRPGSRSARASVPASPPRRSGAARASHGGGSLPTVTGALAADRHAGRHLARAPRGPRRRTSSSSSRPPKPGTVVPSSVQANRYSLRVPAPGARVALDEAAGLRRAEHPRRRRCSPAPMGRGRRRAACSSGSGRPTRNRRPRAACGRPDRARACSRRSSTHPTARQCSNAPVCTSHAVSGRAPIMRWENCDATITVWPSRSDHEGPRVPIQRRIEDDRAVGHPQAEQVLAVLVVAELAAHEQHRAVRRELDVRHVPHQRGSGSARRRWRDPPRPTPRRGTPLTAVNVPPRYSVRAVGRERACEYAEPPVTRQRPRQHRRRRTARTAATPARGTPPICVNEPVT